MGIEIELKFTAADSATLDRVAALDTLAGYRVEARGLIHIRDTAFDTPDRLLYHGGAVFRLRERGDARALTFKAHAPSDGEYYRRIEEESPTTASAEDIARGNLHDIPPVRRLRERFGEVSLSPCLTTENERRVFHLIRDGVSRYELVLDDVTFTGPRGIARTCEVEVEALTDDHSDLEDIGRWLGKRFALTKAGPSKFLLGMNLVGEMPPQVGE